MQARLIPHPTMPNCPVQGVRVEMIREGAILWLRFTAEGEIDRVCWPDEAPPVRADDLWLHTCFEVFVRTPNGYREYNLSPSGCWASYAFEGYRSGMTEAIEVAKVEPLDSAFDQVALEARIELPSDADRLGLSAVIETTGHELHYWALCHPSDKPDFHHPHSFMLALPAPEPQ